MEIETAVIREFLHERFDDGELDALCFDYFADVQQDFTLGMTKGQKIQLLLDHCRRQNRLPDLLAALERERPDLYKSHFGEAAAVPKTAVPVQPGPRNPHQIFISHANRDAGLAHGLAQDLQAHGWQVWIAPDSIQPGEKWVEAIGRGLEESGLFVLAVTAASAASRWVKHEANLAIQLETKGKMRFLPLLVEQAEMPLMWQAYQFLPFTAGDDRSLKELLARLEDKPVQSKTSDFPRKPDETPEVGAGEAARQQPGILSRLGPLPLWGVGALLLVVVLAAWGLTAVFGDPTSPGETREAPSTGTPTSTPTATAIPLPTNTPEPVIIEIPVEISGEIFEISASYILNSSANNITFTFANGSQKEPVNVIVEKANGVDITTSGDMDRGDEKIVTTLLTSDLSGVRIKIFRWAPGLFGAQGSGGGEAFLTLPPTGDVTISIEVLD